jgi:hypothetical protein
MTAAVAASGAPDGGAEPARDALTTSMTLG